MLNQKRMKVFFCFLITLILGVSEGQSQCSIENIFPVKHGLSKYKATAILAGDENFIIKKNLNQYLYDFWGHPEYLNGDSVYYSSFIYNFKSFPCFEAQQNEIEFNFVDDKLYKTVITLNYPPTAYGRSTENYLKLISDIKYFFADISDYTVTNDSTGEQVGEGYWFYPTLKSQRDKIKIEKLAIEFRIKYTESFDSISKIWHRTSNVENYIIELTYLNLKGTKLTNDGY